MSRAVSRLAGVGSRCVLRGVQRPVASALSWTRAASQPQFAPAIPVRLLCAPAVPSDEVSKTLLINIYKEIGQEARKVMLEAEDKIRTEVDEKLAGGMDMDLAASMYGHQMAQYMAEFLPLPNKPDSVVQRIRESILSTKGVASDSLDEAFKTFEKDHEVQLVLSTMYQHKLDEATLPEDMNLDKYIDLTSELQRLSVETVEKLNENINSKAGAYMTDNQRKELDGARQAVPTIAVFTAQYQALNEGGVSYQDKLLADLMFAVWPRAQQANAQLQQAIQDAQLKYASPIQPDQ